MCCDVSKSDEIHRVMQQVANEKGAVHILVNNVGVQLDDGQACHELSEQIWHKVLNINLTSFFLFSKLSIPSMLQAGSGVIINMASVQGLQSQAGIPAYAASKGAILSLTRQMAMEYSSRGIRTLAVCPGTINTPLVAKLLTERPGASYEKASACYPMKRIGEVHEIAEVVCFLASARASFMSGEHIVVDGGIMSKGGW